MSGKLICACLALAASGAFAASNVVPKLDPAQWQRQQRHHAEEQRGHVSRDGKVLGRGEGRDDIEALGEGPAGNAGLVPPAIADAVAHILAVNKYPAGTTELAKDKAALKSIKIEAAK